MIAALTKLGCCWRLGQCTLEEDDSDKRDDEPHAACLRQICWPETPISSLNEALTPARKQFQTFSSRSQRRCSEVIQYTTIGSFTAATPDWNWSHDTALRRPSSLWQHANKIAHDNKSTAKSGRARPAPRRNASHLCGLRLYFSVVTIVISYIFGNAVY